MRSKWLLVGACCAAALGAGCEKKRSEGGGHFEQAEAAQERSQQAMERAREAQSAANDKQKQAGEARADVVEAQNNLREAEERARKDAEEARAAQLKAQEESQKAQAEVASAQQQAIAAQQAAQAPALAPSESPPPTQGGVSQNIEGRIVRSDAQQLVIAMPDKPEMPLQITPETRVTVDGQSSSVAELRPGETVRAAFQDEAGTQKVISIEVQRNGSVIP